MKVFKEQIFSGFRSPRNSPAIGSVCFDRCQFRDCTISWIGTPRERLVIEDVALTRCVAASCHLWPSVLRNIRIDGLKSTDMMIINGSCFDRVKLKGRIGSLLITPSPPPVTGLSPHNRKEYIHANKGFYTSVDWAIDISTAQFEGECSINGIPVDLVRRDPETQRIVRRERAINVDWRAYRKVARAWHAELETFLARGEEATVFIAGRGRADFSKLMEGFAEMEKIGLVLRE